MVSFQVVPFSSAQRLRSRAAHWYIFAPPLTRGAPPILQPLGEAAFHPRTELGGDHFDQSVDGLIRLPKAFDLPNRVKNGRVVATVIKSADPGRAPSRHVLRQIHRNLPTQAGRSLLPRDASISEMIRDRGFDLLQ
ncbi:MAG TPA: hypothetical protein VN828_09170 [Acidobacteriaceae bacterium]|nr:hypothetical protein [Acidobacteriaceae bacterium]